MMPTIGGSRPRRLRWIVLPALAVAAAWALAASLFVVDVSERAVVTRFGGVVRVVDAPGLYATLPIDGVRRLDRRLLLLAPPEAEYLTADKKNVVIRSLIAWRVADPVRFLSKLGNRAQAETALADVALSEIGAVMGRHPFSALVSVGGRADWGQTLVAEIRDRVGDAVRSDLGIDVAEVSIRSLSLPEQNRQSVFERMRAERGRIAMKYRSEGELDAKRMIAAADREKVELDARSWNQSQRTRAEGDAEASRIYAEAASRYAGFYRFLRTLQAEETILADGTVLVLPAEAEALGLLQESAATPVAPPPPGLA
ncbi:MAG TPA: protease modulator HflC, partial [Acetobacteraceae bacterium]|nr:protease modulator HflC [Acetobacteraceae bacterium]